MFQLTTLEDYSDDALLAELRRVATALGGQRLTQQRFLEYSRVHTTTVRNRFGSWKAALDRAGIDPAILPRRSSITRAALLEAVRSYATENSGASPTVDEIAVRLGVFKTTIPRKFGPWRNLLAEVGLSPVPLGRRYTDTECFENLVALWTHYGRQPSFAELNQRPSNVGSKAYVRRWGGWRAALAAFVRQMEQQHGTEVQSVEVASSPESSMLIVTSVPSIPRSISLALRYKVLSRDHFRCVACGRSPAKDHGVELHVDHIVPWSKGGHNVESNLRTLCFDCNLGKGAKLDGA